MKSDWRKVSLGEVITHQKGSAFKSKDFQKAGIPVVRVSNFTSDSIDIADLYFVSKDVAEENKNVELQANDIVIATVGSWPSNPASIVGKTIRVPQVVNGALLNQNSVRLRVKDSNPDDQVFLYYVLKRPEFISYLVSTAQGSANQASITLKDIFNYRFEWPDKEERKVIGEFFDALDKKIELNRQINQTLEQIAQAVFKSWFVDFEPVRAKIAAKQALTATLYSGRPALHPSGRADVRSNPLPADLSQWEREEIVERAAMRAISGKTDAELDQLSPGQFQQLSATAALFPDELVDSELGEIPKGWDIRKVDMLLSRLSSKIRYKKDEVKAHGKVPVFEQGSGILLGYHDGTAQFDASPDDPAFIFGDHTCVTYLSCKPFDISQNVIALKGNDRPTLWVFYAIKNKQEFQEYRRHWMELIAKDVIVAPAPICEVFAKLMSFQHLEIESNVLQNRELAAIRDTLLPKLLSGELTTAQAEQVMEDARCA